VALAAGVAGAALDGALLDGALCFADSPAHAAAARARRTTRRDVTCMLSLVRMDDQCTAAGSASGGGRSDGPAGEE